MELLCNVHLAHSLSFSTNRERCALQILVSPLAGIQIDCTTFQPSVTFTTLMLLITFNDLPSPQKLLFSALHFVPTAIDRTVPGLRPACTTLDMSTSVPAIRTPKAPTSVHLPEPLAPPSPPQPPNPGRSIKGSQLS